MLDKLQEQYHIEAIYPANSLQQGFIYHAISQPEDDAYRVQILFDYLNKLDVKKYRQAWQHAVDTFPMLRTCFNWDEELIQIITRDNEIIWEEHDIRTAADKENAIVNHSTTRSY